MRAAAIAFGVHPDCGIRVSLPLLILRGWAFAALAALVALTARGLGRLGHPRLVAALVITAFFWPAVPGIVAEYGVYEWRDPIGQVLSVAVALGQAAVLGWQVRHFRARRHELLPG